MPLLEDAVLESEEDIGLEEATLDEMLVVVDHLEQTLDVMNNVVQQLKGRIEEVRDSLCTELSAEEFLEQYEDPQASVH